jgi:hypothetical protein
MGLAVSLLTSCQGSLEGGPFPAMTRGPGSGGDSGTGGSGTGGSGSGGSGSGGSIGGDCDAPAMVFNDAKVGCGGGCHTPGGLSAPDLTVADLASELKGMKATQLCKGENMVDTANPTNSVLYKVLVNDDCGALMPLGATTPLSASQLACVADWIGKL